MSQAKTILKPQDVVVLLKIISLGEKQWLQETLAEAIGLSQSEISQSLNRSKYAGLLDYSGKKVFRIAFTEFILYGLPYVFSQQPGPIVRGILTAHSAAPLNKMIEATEKYVWPYALGTVRGQAILPLYPTVPKAALQDVDLYELLSLIDALRVGRVREKELAKTELKKRILNV